MSEVGEGIAVLRGRENGFKTSLENTSPCYPDKEVLQGDFFAGCVEFRRRKRSATFYVLPDKAENWDDLWRFSGRFYVHEQ